MKQLLKYLSDIRFWFVFFFLVRLYGITNPPLDVAHNWRQTTVTMVARNYLEVDNNIFHPRIDVCGEKTGITGMEFPILNYLIYLISKIFGYQHWYGRLINLLVSTIGIWYFYKLIKKYFNEKHAYSSAMLLLGSIWFAYSRKIMPDTFAVSLVLIGIYHGLSYFTDKQNWVSLLYYFGFSLIGILSKLPMGYLLMVFALPFFSKSTSLKTKINFIIINVLLLSIVAWYYFIWVPYLTNFYGLKHFFMGKSIVLGSKEILQNWKLVIEKYYLDSMHITGFLLFFRGCFFAIKHRKSQPFVITIFLLCSAVFFVLMLKSGETFAIHSYYIVPFTPLMAFVAGYAASQFQPKYMAILLSVVIIENIANWQHDFRLKPQYAKFENLEKDLDKHCKRSDLIFINSNEVPTPLYFAHRKGWSERNILIEQPHYVDSLQRLGLKYIVITKDVFGAKTTLKYNKIDSFEFYDIYQVKP